MFWGCKIGLVLNSLCVEAKVQGESRGICWLSDSKILRRSISYFGFQNLVKRWVPSKDDSELCRYFESVFLTVKVAYRELQFTFFMLDSE